MHFRTDRNVLRKTDSKAFMKCRLMKMIEDRLDVLEGLYESEHTGHLRFRASA